MSCLFSFSRMFCDAVKCNIILNHAASLVERLYKQHCSPLPPPSLFFILFYKLAFLVFSLSNKAWKSKPPTLKMTTIGLIPGYFPPSQQNYDLLLTLWKWFPAFASLQWFLSFYGMGKTSLPSSLFNIPGRIAWFTMEIPGFLTLLYTFRTLSPDDGLPWQNTVLSALFVIHYIYRAILFPFLQPSMSPIHFTIWFSAFIFQIINGTLLGGWLSGYYHGAAPITASAWGKQTGILQFSFGIAVFYLGLVSNYYHDDELREIRRRELNRQEKQQQMNQQQGVKKGKGVEKHYEIPKAGLFKWVLYPHYLLEWLEWFGFWMACGWGSVPARCFLVNEISSMLPRAVKGKKWYVERFGEEKVGRKWAVIPGVL
ncbi:putative 3-oxo-5-alpha-steroid 4-dehydrogenase [Podospora fimiseda]|uniref:3-oxo-5-alpha-steroid 4-dehydrogenase n=1 Tax=Podospora fimiseda TaxID=252190 RepID=A0AAN7BTT7_9PEZI|nr:putative 3-oxo-5-alpha-steroid 4-dehydrogenase [Podospora fimiseda]